jgi:hypothetical protein
MPAQRYTMPDPNPDTLSPLRALYSLREADVDALRQGFSENQEAWSFDRHESYDGDLTVMLTPPDEAEPTLVVSRDEGGFHLAANRGDDYQDLGSFGSVTSVVSAMSAQTKKPETTDTGCDPNPSGDGLRDS